MKKLGFCFMVLLVFLAGCKTSTPKPEEPTDKDKTETKVYQLGAYGDYVKYIDDTKDASALETDYLSLMEKKKESAHGVFQSNYCQGLLKFFSIDEKIKLTIEISKEELKKLEEDYQTGNKESYRICNLD
ncbi:MAG: hypothetical protein K2J85_02505, partial [Anaeroplasmataceae bacterium]|nr:hypothetical protein [Anaeroplasmataceae bacterium]